MKELEERSLPKTSSFSFNKKLSELNRKKKRVLRDLQQELIALLAWEPNHDVNDQHDNNNEHVHHV